MPSSNKGRLRRREPNFSKQVWPRGATLHKPLVSRPVLHQVIFLKLVISRSAIVIPFVCLLQVLEVKRNVAPGSELFWDYRLAHHT